ncbi:MAG: OmpH family outer membrane protein [Armatimonadetes bacterium]|nr:OmpH family outer membrane protein [Armatimonadota bacterium]MDW8122818.1 OmpH family outer membrane protein [Armatimonadota bacterium]
MIGRWFLIAVGCFFLILWWSAPRADQGWKIGLVNGARIAIIAERLAQQKSRYEEQRKAYLDLITLRQNFALLTGLEWAELRILMAKAPRTKEEEKRLAELRQIQIDREVQLKRLQQTAPALLSPADKATLDHLTRLWKTARDDIAELKNLLEEELKRIEKTIGKERDEKTAKAIETVARDRDLDLVLDQSACYYAKVPLIDITDEVIKALEGDATDASPPAASEPKREEAKKS